MGFIKKHAYIILGLICVLALGGLYIVGRTSPSGVMDTGQTISNPNQVTIDVMAQAPPDTQEPESELSNPEDQPSEPVYITVHIVGEVNYPGVYQVHYGSRIYDVLQLAGGYTDDADLSLVNLAAFVQDATQIRIPATGEEPFIADPSSHQANQPASDGLININTATMKLKIGLVSFIITYFLLHSYYEYA